MRVVVAYDISSDEKRQKAADLLLMEIPRVQESVFEGEVPEGVLVGLRMRPEALKRYFELYEEQLRAPSEGGESPPWRERMRHQVEAVREMVMGGEPAPFYQWPG